VDRAIRVLTKGSETYATKSELETLRLLCDSLPVPRSEGQEIVYLPQLLRVAANIQNTIKNVTKEIDALKESAGTFVLRSDLTEFVDAVSAALQTQQTPPVESTAGGRVVYKCLLCGRPTPQVTGMITDGEIARLIGEPPTSALAKAGGDFALVYGREGVYRAQSAQHKKRIPPALPKIGNRTGQG
jgi:hypothetical protein